MLFRDILVYTFRNLLLNTASPDMLHFLKVYIVSNVLPVV